MDTAPGCPGAAQCPEKQRRGRDSNPRTLAGHTISSRAVSTGLTHLSVVRRIPCGLERLKAPSESVEYLSNVVNGLNGRLGTILYQLPPFFKCDAQKLELFLSVLPRGTPATFEFRHESWFVETIYRLLRKYNVALCIHDADDHTTPMEVTAGFTYVRLRRTAYDLDQAHEWQERIRQWARDGTDVFAYIKHQDNPNAPLIAVEFAKDLVQGP